MSFSSFIDNLSKGADSITQIVGATTTGIDQVSESVKNFELPPIKTESSFNLGWESYVGFGALILFGYLIFKRK